MKVKFLQEGGTMPSQEAPGGTPEAGGAPAGAPAGRGLRAGTTVEIACL